MGLRSFIYVERQGCKMFAEVSLEIMEVMSMRLARPVCFRVVFWLDETPALRLRLIFVRIGSAVLNLRSVFVRIGSAVLIICYFGSSWLRWQSLHLIEALALRESGVAEELLVEQSTARLGEYLKLGVGITSLIF